MMKITAKKEESTAECFTSEEMDRKYFCIIKVLRKAVAKVCFSLSQSIFLPEI